MIVPVILSGGEGKRLWPMSSAAWLTASIPESSPPPRRQPGPWTAWRTPRAGLVNGAGVLRVEAEGRVITRRSAVSARRFPV